LHSINTVDNLKVAKSGRRGEGAQVLARGGGWKRNFHRIFPTVKKRVPIEPRNGITTDQTTVWWYPWGAGQTTTITSAATMDLFMWTVKDVRRSELASPPPPPPSSYPSYGRRTEKGRIFGRKNLGLRYGILRRSVAVKMVNIKIKYVRQRVAMRVRVVKVLTDFSSCPPESVRRETF